MWDINNAAHTYVHVCIFAPVPGLLENSRVYDIWIRIYFGPGPATVDSVGVSYHCAFWRHGSKLTIFCIASTRMNCIFWDAFFELIRNLATLDPNFEKLQEFQVYGTLITSLHPRTWIVTVHRFSLIFSSQGTCQKIYTWIFRVHRSSEEVDVQSTSIFSRLGY